MRNKIFVSVFWLCVGLGLFMGLALDAQEPVNSSSHIRVVVDLVQLNVAVTDSRGNYVTGLQPSDFVVMEDGIPQKISTFAEGNAPARRLADAPQTANDANGGTSDGQQSERGQDATHLTAAELSSNVSAARTRLSRRRPPRAFR